jgi:hypothetical protein
MEPGRAISRKQCYLRAVLAILACLVMLVGTISVPSDSQTPRGINPYSEKSTVVQTVSVQHTHIDLGRILDGRASSLGPFEAGVEAITSDPNATYNLGINTTITIPASYAAPAAGCSWLVSTATFCGFMGITERTNSSALAAAGIIFILENGAPKPMAFASLPNGSFITGTDSDLLTLGQTYSFSFVHAHGDWWTFGFAGPTTGAVTGGSKWENGTYFLNASVAPAVDIPTQGGFPTLFLDEFGNSSFILPEIRVPNAIGIERSGSTETSYRPTSGNAANVNVSYPLGIQGRIQNLSLPVDSLNVAGNLTFPATAAPLWGRSSPPLGVFTPQAVAYTLEGTVAGNEGIGFSMTIPATSSNPNQAMIVAAEEPVNSTLQIGVGIVLFSGGADPFCFFTNASAGSFYLSSTPSLPVGSSVLLQAQSAQRGWWDFTFNGNPITNSTSAADNGTGYIGLDSAAAIIGTAHNVGDNEFGVTTFPELAVYGNSSLGFLAASDTLLFNEPGRGWLSPDYSQGYHWNPGMRVEASQQNSSIPNGETIFGTNATAVPYSISGEGALLWTGEMNVYAYVSNPTIVPGEVTTILANVTSVFTIPSSFSFCVSTGTGCTLDFYRISYGVNWSAYWANYTGPALASTSSITVTVTVNASFPPDYTTGSQTVRITVKPSNLVLQARALATVIAAGNTTTFYLWINDSLGPVSGAAIQGTVDPISGQGYLVGIGPVGSDTGLYTAKFGAPATLTSRTFYNITFYANATGAWRNASNTIEVEVGPLPSLGVDAYCAPTFLYASEAMSVLVNVSSGHIAQGGAEVKVNGTPGWWLVVASGVTGGNGEYGLNLTVPANVTAPEGFIITVTASMPWHRSASTDLTVKVVPSIVEWVHLSYASTTVNTGGKLTLSAVATCMPGVCPASLVYDWSTNNTLGNVSSTAGPDANFTAGQTPGTTMVTVVVQVYGSSVTVNLVLTIAKPSSSSTSFLSGTTLWVIIVAVVIVVALIAIILVLRRKNGAPAPEAALVETTSAAPPPSSPSEPGKPPWSED